MDAMEVDTGSPPLPPRVPEQMAELDAFGADIDVGATATATPTVSARADLELDQEESSISPPPPAQPLSHPPKRKQGEPTSPVSPEIPKHAQLSAVTFPGEKDFSADNTDSDGSGPPASPRSEDNVETLDSDTLSALDVRAHKPLDYDHDDNGAGADAGTVPPDVTRALQTQAVELCVEARIPHRTRNKTRALFIVLFLRGAVPNSWAELDRTEAVIAPDATYRWVHKMRLPAATTLDRSEHVALAVFSKDGPESPDDGLNASLSACELRVAQLVQAPAMALDIELSSPRTGRVRGSLALAADLVPHREHDELLTLDVGFDADAPARNRIIYVVSRSVPKGRWTPVYRSEVRTRGELDRFRPAVLTNRELNGDNDKRLIRIEFYRYYKNKSTALLGFCQTSLLSMRTCVLGAPIYWWPAQDGIPHARVLLTERQATEEASKFVLRVVPSSRKMDS